MCFRTCLLAFLSSLALIGSAQQATRQAPQNLPAPTFGSFIGHVYCSDNNAPARLAKVTLMPIPEDSSPPASADKPNKHPRQVFTPIQTVLDGSFTMPRVEAGNYYVVVQYPGYISPTSQLTNEDLVHPSLEMQKFIASVLPTISVAANRVTTTDIRLQRGAAITGTLRYDDGSPAAGLSVHILHKDKKDHWAKSFAERAESDDQGRYRIFNLSAGEYILETDLGLSDQATNVLFDSSSGNAGGAYSSSTKYSLSIFSGGETRQRDAKHIKLNNGEEDSGEDITIPISKLHSVTGSITQARTGRVINAGTVVLQYSDEKSEIASAKVDKDDSTFHFDFVPEGNYVLKVTNARDVSREEIPNSPGSMPPSSTKETTIQTYGPQQQPITIIGDMTGVLVPVPDKTATPKNTQ